jgi:hypothetical protein
MFAQLTLYNFTAHTGGPAQSTVKCVSDPATQQGNPVPAIWRLQVPIEYGRGLVKDFDSSTGMDQ